MAELVDALASGASVRMDVEVRVLFWAPFFLVFKFDIITNDMVIVIAGLQNIGNIKCLNLWIVCSNQELILLTDIVN